MDNQTCWESWLDLGYPCSVGVWMMLWWVSTGSNNLELILVPGIRVDTEDELKGNKRLRGWTEPAQGCTQKRELSSSIDSEIRWISRKHTPRQKKYKDNFYYQIHISMRLENTQCFFKGWLCEFRPFYFKMKIMIVGFENVEEPWGAY